MTATAGLLRHVRASNGLSQRALAARSGVATSTLADLESERRRPALAQAVNGAGWRLAAFPAAEPDPERDAQLRHHLARHPVDRAELAARERGGLHAGLPPREWVALLDTLLQCRVLVVGPAALHLWLPVAWGLPDVQRLELVAGPDHDPARLAALGLGDAILVHADPCSAGLPAGVLRAAIPLDLWGPYGSRVLAPRDLLRTRGWLPDLARLVEIHDDLVDRDAALRQEPPHRGLDLQARVYTWVWPSRRDQGRGSYPIPSAARRRPGRWPGPSRQPVGREDGARSGV